MFRKLRYGTRKEKGQTVVLVAVMLVTLLGLSALAVDLSFVFVQRRNMQNGADAGALAGARMLALYAAEETMSYRCRDLYYEILRAAQANGADEIKAFLIRRSDGQPYQELKPDDFRALPRCPAACGVWVKSDRDFRTFLSQLFGVQTLAASAEAQAQFGKVEETAGIAPIGLRNTIVEGMELEHSYTFWDSKKEGGATRGWLGLDCVYPAKGSSCSPDSKSLKQWIKPPDHYTGIVKTGWSIGGDPGVRTAVLHEAVIGDTLIIPVFDYCYHFTNNKFCNPADPKYDWDKCMAGEAYEGTLPVYTSDSGYNGKYYYHIVSFAAFKVEEKGTQGSDKYLFGKFLGDVRVGSGEVTCPDRCAGQRFYGVALVKLVK